MAKNLNIAHYWELAPTTQRSLIDEVIIPEEPKCECLDLAPVHPGDKYVCCVECGAMYEIITPYVIHRVPLAKD